MHRTDVASSANLGANLPIAGRAVWLDRAGMLASLLCAVHCAASALAMGLLTTLGAAGLLDPRVETTFLFMAVAFGLLSFLPAFRRHRSVAPLLWFAFGLALLLGLRPAMPEGWPEAAVVVVGAVMVIRAHWHNTRLLNARRHAVCAIG